MGCGPEVAGGVYHPRQPQQTPFYQLVERFYQQFEAVYPEVYQEHYGFWRPINMPASGHTPARCDPTLIP